MQDGVVQQLQTLDRNKIWADIVDFIQGPSPGTDPTQWHEGLYWVIVVGGEPQAVYLFENNTWTQKANTDDNHFYKNNLPSNFANDGDVWIALNNTTDKQAIAWYKAVNHRWVFQFAFGAGGGITIETAILVQSDEVT